MITIYELLIHNYNTIQLITFNYQMTKIKKKQNKLMLPIFSKMQFKNHQPFKTSD